MNVQTFLADKALEAAAEAEAALMRLPEDKRLWSAGGTEEQPARNALDMIAEIALLNGTTADMIEKRQGMTDFNLDEFNRQTEALLRDWPALKKLLDENTQRVSQAIRSVPSDELETELPMPWGPMTLLQIMEYPYWNAKYHEGQINFIASLLGCLK